jgi:cysteine desulfurase
LGRQRPKVPVECQIDGGGHEHGLRSGTLNVPGIVGLGACAELARRMLPDESARLAAMRDRLFMGLRDALQDVRVNGSLERRLPHNLHITFEGIEGEALLMALGDIAVSTGSACSSGSQAPSHVLQAIGAVGDTVGASIRFGLGRWTTDADIDLALERVTTVVRSLRERHPVARS